MGKATFNWYGDEVMQSLIEAIDEGLKKAGQELLDFTNEYDTPIDTEALIDSSFVDVGDNKMNIGYDKWYAVRVHEGIDENGNELTIHRGRKTKYLEDNLFGNADELFEMIAEVVRKEWK